jgi:hypothetical protein
LRFRPLVETRWADSSSVERIPLITALAEPLVLFSGRPAAEGAADARGFGLAGFLVFLTLVVWSNGGSIGRWTHLFGLLNSIVFGKAASVLPDHAHFFPTQTSVLDRHAEERVFVLLVVGGKGVLVEQHQFRVIRARFRELRKLLPDGWDHAGLSLHSFVTGHLAMRIADSESGRIPQMEMAHRLTSPPFC